MAKIQSKKNHSKEAINFLVVFFFEESTEHKHKSVFLEFKLKKPT